jgi:hypothetical protein
MSISYAGIIGYGSGKVTLPSVESWGTNFNILRDPPKSISTRRIDKVGQTSSITEMIDGSENRACEAISMYARGVNPSISVDYGNAGNNGGQHSSGFCGGVGSDIGSSGNRTGGGQAYLPYRVVRDGAFRPPIVSPFNLMPLSRQPRVNTDAFTKPGFADFTKKLVCPGGNYRQVKESTLKACIRPTATYRIDTPIVEPFEVKYVIKNPVKFDSRAGVTGIKTQDITMQYIQEPTKEINTTPLYTDVYTNLSGETVKYVDNSHMNTDPYIQDTLHSSVQSKRSQPGETVRYVDNSCTDADRYIHDTLHSSVQTKRSQSIQVTPIDNFCIDTDHYIQDTLHSSVQSKRSQSIQVTPIDNSCIDTDHYIQDTLHSSVQSKRSQSIQITPIEDIFDVDVRTKDAINISYTPLKTGPTKEDYIHKDIELERRVLATPMATNKQRNIYSRPQYEYQAEQKRNRPIVEVVTNLGTTQRQGGFDLNNRDYNLKPTISAGGMTGRGQMPAKEVNSDIRLGESTQNVRNRKVLEMQLGRH